MEEANLNIEKEDKEEVKEAVEEKPKKSQENQAKKVILPILAIALIILIITIYKSRPYDYKYNTFEVKAIDQGKITTYSVKIVANEQPIYLSTRYDPRYLEDAELYIEPNLKNKILKNQIFITQDPDEKLKAKATIATLEINNILEFVYNANVNSAVTKEYKNLTIKDCIDVNKGTSIIKLTLNNETKVTSENDCIIIGGKTEEDLIKLADKLMFNILGVMN